MCREKAGGQDEMRMLRAMYAEGEERLRQAGIEEAGLDAWYLLEFVTGVDKAHYYMEPDRRMEQSVAQEYEKVVNLRAEHIPLQHITGVQEFMGLGFRVSGDVLIPRQDTEVLVEELVDNGDGLVAKGRAEFQAPEVDGNVYIENPGDLKPGDFCKVRIVDGYAYDLIANRI